MPSEKLNCWEAMQCDREPGGSRAEELGPCAAATDVTCDGINDGKNAGRLCWAVTQPLCDGEAQASFEQRIGNCQNCRFFRRVKYEQGCHFQLLHPGLGAVDADELHRLLKNVVKLIGISRDICACLAVRPLLSRIAEHACTITRSASASVYLVDGAKDQLILEAHAGPVRRPERIRLDADAPVARASRTRRPHKDVVILPGRQGSAAAVAVPIGGQEKRAPVLELVKTAGPFSVDDEWFLREFGLMAGMGMENAHHVEDLRQLKRFDKAKSRFVALLMHHIASPLATIACSLEAISQLGEKLGPEDRQELIESSLERIDAIQGLSRRLLDLAAIRNGTSLADIRPIRPAEPIRKEVEGRQAQAKEKGVEIVMTERGDASLIMADPDGLRLIFGNLLGNAIKYSTGPDKRVDVDLTVEHGHIRIGVRDRGIGIPAEEQTRVFEEFHRASNVTAADASGFGLGLATVKELVDRYGGHIELTSEIGVGTCVAVEFPVVDEEETPEPPEKA